MLRNGEKIQPARKGLLVLARRDSNSELKKAASVEMDASAEDVGW